MSAWKVVEVRREDGSPLGYDIVSTARAPVAEVNVWRDRDPIDGEAHRSIGNTRKSGIEDRLAAHVEHAARTGVGGGTIQR